MGYKTENYNRRQGIESSSKVKTSKCVRFFSILVDTIFICILPYFALLTTVLLSKKSFNQGKIFGLSLAFTLGFFIIRDIATFFAIRFFDKVCKKINDSSTNHEMGSIIRDNVYSNCCHRAHYLHSVNCERIVTSESYKQLNYSVYKVDLLGNRGVSTMINLIMIILVPAVIIVCTFVLASLSIMSKSAAIEISVGLAMFVPASIIIFAILGVTIFGGCIHTNYNITPINLAVAGNMLLKHMDNNPPDNLFLREDVPIKRVGSQSDVCGKAI